MFLVATFAAAIFISWLILGNHGNLGRDVMVDPYPFIGIFLVIIVYLGLLLLAGASIFLGLPLYFILRKPKPNAAQPSGQAISSADAYEISPERPARTRVNRAGLAWLYVSAFLWALSFVRIEVTRIPMYRNIFLVFISIVGLNACIALPDYSRDEKTTRFQAIPIVDLPDDQVVYLVNRCTDRPDRKELCSDSGDHGQFLTLQRRGWKIEKMFFPAATDFPLSTYVATKYGTFIPSPKFESGMEEIPIGDFVSLQWGMYKPRTVRVWLRLAPITSFRSSQIVDGELTNSSEKKEIWPMNPTIVCRKSVTEYHVETMLMPLIYTYKEYKLGQRVSESCDVSK